jgi:dephospho-CoA kinase
MMRSLIVGLTGGLATGKSTVAGMFGRLGAGLVDCDRLAHAALRRGTPVYRRVVKQWGPGICATGGEIDRKALARRVFASARERRRLEGLVHPAVRRELRDRLRKSRRKITVAEIPLLFETDFHRQVARTVTVTAPRAEQIARARRKLGISAAEAAERIAAQLSLRDKAKRSDYVIHNDGSLKNVFTQVQKIWNHLKKDAASAARCAGSASVQK